MSSDGVGISNGGFRTRKHMSQNGRIFNLHGSLFHPVLCNGKYLPCTGREMWELVFRLHNSQFFIQKDTSNAGDQIYRVLVHNFSITVGKLQLTPTAQNLFDSDLRRGLMIPIRDYDMIDFSVAKGTKGRTFPETSFSGANIIRRIFCVIGEKKYMINKK